MITSISDCVGILIICFFQYMLIWIKQFVINNIEQLNQIEEHILYY